jgi:hypothetical protein
VASRENTLIEIAVPIYRFRLVGWKVAKTNFLVVIAGIEDGRNSKINPLLTRCAVDRDVITSGNAADCGV